MEESNEPDVDSGTMISKEESGTMISSIFLFFSFFFFFSLVNLILIYEIATGETAEPPSFMQMIKKGGVGKITNLDDLINTGNVAALEDMLKDLKVNMENEIKQTK